jgi:hypothetical protein
MDISKEEFLQSPARIQCASQSWSWERRSGAIDPWSWQNGFDCIKRSKIGADGSRTSQRTVPTTQWHNIKAYGSDGRLIDNNWRIHQILRSGPGLEDWSRHEYRRGRDQHQEEGLPPQRHAEYFLQAYFISGGPLLDPIPLRAQTKNPFVQPPVPLLSCYTRYALLCIDTFKLVIWHFPICCVSIHDEDSS